MQNEGQVVVFRKLNDEEYSRELTKKLLEEAQEFDPKLPKAAQELADVLEVVEALAKELGLSFDDLREVQATIQKKRGSFDSRLFVDTVSMPDSDKWSKYYSEDPIKYEEI